MENTFIDKLVKEGQIGSVSVLFVDRDPPAGFDGDCRPGQHRVSRHRKDEVWLASVRHVRRKTDCMVHPTKCPLGRDLDAFGMTAI